ncbi:MAG: hypothetical protein HY543_06085 [Deltaproteobacteria bacterium]|nr:hypothetical protein [Deltaproteobacteria bacterium]
MRIERRDPPRRYTVGAVQIADCATIDLATDEQVTFATEGRDGYDITRKSWGWYATPSLNGRLPAKGLRAVIARNEAGRAYLLLVGAGREAEFKAYLTSEKMSVLIWLDSDAAIASLAVGQRR